jgi:hypothetical protein
MSSMFFPMDPEEAQRHVEMHQMATESVTHSILSFIENLNEDQLDTMSSILLSVGGENGDLLGAQLNGMIRQIVKFRYGRCQCGKRHESLDGISLDGTAVRPEPVVNAGPVEPPQPADPLILLAAASEKEVSLLKQYNLYKHSSGKLTCVGCGLEYISLRDRMVKEPDDCHGCKLKAGHG